MSASRKELALAMAKLGARTGRRFAIASASSFLLALILLPVIQRLSSHA